ncbi:MAG: CoA transferase, partial [Alphaproteobacteria bacterium]
WWLENLEKNKIGCGPINDLSEVFSDPQVLAREMIIEMDHPATGGKAAQLIASPLKLSGTPVSYRRSPPMLGEHTEEVLREKLSLSDAEIADLKSKKII